MEQPSSPSQCTGDHTRDGHDPRNCSCALYELVYSFAHPPEPAETLATQPAAALSSQGVALSPCFFGPPGPAIPNIWFDPAVEVAGVSSTTDGSRARSSPNTSASDWARALSLSSPNDVEAADESLLSPVSPIADRAHQAPGFQCQWRGCRSSTSFRRPAELVRHVKTIHIDRNAYPCPDRNCGMAFGRKDHLQAHSKTHHKPSRQIRHGRQA